MKHILRILLLFISVTAVAQQPLLHIDKPFYVNGEVVWYQLYLPAAFAEKEIAIKAVFLSPEGEERHSTFHKTGGTLQVSGYYKLPFDIPTGTYLLRFQALQQVRQEAVILAEAELPVYNDNEVTALEKRLSTEEISVGSPMADVPDELQISVEVVSGPAAPREAVEVVVRVKDQSGRPVSAKLSAAVTDKAVLPAMYQAGTLRKGETINAAVPTQLTGTLYGRAQLLDAEGAPRVASVIGAYSALENQLFYARRTDSEGRIFLELPDFSGEKPIQFLGYEREEEDIFTRYLAETHSRQLPAPPVTQEVLAYLSYSQQRKKVFQNYKALEFELTPAARELDVQRTKADQTINIKDYESFDNVAIFFQEILTPVRFKEDRKNDTYAAYMYNPRLGYRKQLSAFEGRPLFIVDGKVTRNADFIGKLDLAQIETAELFFGPDKLKDYFNVLGKNGVTRLTTNNPDIRLPEADENNIHQFAGLQRSAVFPAFSPAELEGRRPFFRPQLHWTTDLETDVRGEVRFRFYQSDDVSTFRVAVTGQSEDGKMGYGEVEYEVAY